MTTLVCVVGLLMLNRAEAKWVAEPAEPALQAPAEASSELADLWRERDAYYLRVDGQLPRQHGIAPRGSQEAVLRFEALTRGREFPGRYTMVELEVKATSALEIAVGFKGSAVFKPALTAGASTKLRLPLPDKVADLVISPSAGQAGLAAGVEFGRVRLVDDRWAVWSEGDGFGRWSIERSAGVFHIRPRVGPELAYPSASGEWELVEASVLRARFQRKGEVATVYASGLITGSPGAELPGPRVEGGRVVVTISEDAGRIDRNTAGDTDGDGYNEARGATIIRLSERRSSFTIAPVKKPEVVRDFLSPTSRKVRSPEPTRPAVVALELRGLPPGRETVLLEGTLLKSIERLADGTLLVQLPGELRMEARMEVSIDTSALTPAGGQAASEPPAR